MTQDEIIEMARQVARQPDRIYAPDEKEFLYYFAVLAFEKGRLQGMAQERALWELSKITQELGPIETYIEKKQEVKHDRQRTAREGC
jgi:hypothetical protein